MTSDDSGKGWASVTADTVNPVVTISDIVAVTGFSRRTIRCMINRYQVPALPRHGTRDTLRYGRRQLIAAIKTMAGSGRRIDNHDGTPAHDD